MLTLSEEQKFHLIFVQGSKSSREQKFLGTKVPGNESTKKRKFHVWNFPSVPCMELSFPGAKVHGNESSCYLCNYDSVSFIVGLTVTILFMISAVTLTLESKVISHHGKQ